MLNEVKNDCMYDDYQRHITTTAPLKKKNLSPIQMSVFFFFFYTDTGRFFAILL